MSDNPHSRRTSRPAIPLAPLIDEFHRHGRGSRNGVPVVTVHDPQVAGTNEDGHRRSSRNSIPLPGTEDSRRRASRPAVPLYDTSAATAAMCEQLGYAFADASLLTIALTHPSFRNEYTPGGADNQRLEFLGDAVLGLLITHELVQRLPERHEGELTVLKSQLVRESSLAVLAEDLGLGQALSLGRGEDQTGGRQRPSVLADALEAVVGAVFEDAGYERTRAVVLRLFDTAIVDVVSRVETIGQAPTALSASTANWKTAVQELLQHLGEQPPVYSLTAEEGPVHARHFYIRATAQVGNHTLTADGEGASKKSAEHAAAECLYRSVLELAGPDPPPLVI